MQKNILVKKLPLSKLGNDYLTGSANRQDYLETAISWISDDKLKQYMAENQNEAKRK
jgi:hypothetical protein